jgi:hypothetical protein
MDFSIFRPENSFHFSHEVEGQMAIVENNPITSSESFSDLSKGRAFHFFSHGCLLGREFLEFPRVVINIGGGISTSREQIENWLARLRLFPNLSNRVSYGSCEFIIKHLGNELIGSDDSSVLTERSNKDELKERSKLGVSVDLVLIIRDGLGLGSVGIVELSPFRGASGHAINNTLVEHKLVSTELVLVNGNNVIPSLLF